MAYFVGAYWGPRQEDREACAERVASFLQALVSLDPGLSRWYKQMASKKSPLRPIPYEREKIAPLLTITNTDIPKRPIIEMGFGFSCWAGFETPLEASILISCGMFSPVLTNAALLSFNPKAHPALDLLSAILKHSVAAFDPDYAVVNTDERLRAGAPLSLRQRPALFRYERGRGYSEND